MFGPKAAPRPRPMGGMGGHSSENLDEDALQQAMSQSGATGTLPTGGAGGAPGAAGANPLAGLGGGAQPDAPREIGTLQEELITRPAKDVMTGLLSIFDLKAALGIDPQTDDPQTQAKKQQMLQRFSSLTEEQQAIAQQEYQQRMAQKQQQEQEEAARKQYEQQQQNQSFSVPTGPQKGAQNPGGSKKQQAAQRLQQDRKSLSNAKGAN